MSGLVLLKFTCKDSMCRAEILISNLETNIECSYCGIKYDRTALQCAEPVSDYNSMKEKCMQRVILASLLPKRGAESVKVNGLSNYYCKLLSPLLTNYGMNPTTGLAQLLTEMNKHDILDCSIFKDRAFLINPDQLSIVGFGRDVSGSMNYLSETLKIMKEANNGEERLVPIYTDGDGHCLVHAISRALVGRELFWHPLRCCLKKHFEENLIQYQELFKDFMEPEDWKAIIEECDPDFKPPEWELHGLRNVHIFGLANVLKRPIILLDSLECMRKCGDYSALFLPVFVPPEECKGRDNTLNKPICIAWSSFSHNHYIPLVGVQNSPLPVLPQNLIPKVWGVPQSQFENYIELDSSGNCVIGGSRVLSEIYIQRLVKAMETLFLEKNGIHPMLVADAKLYFYSEPAFLNLKVATVIENIRELTLKGYLYRCLYCKAMCKLEPSFFRSGGLVYNLLLEEYKNFNSATSYKVADSGLSCKYDPVKNEFTIDMSKTILPNCTRCESSNVKRIRPDGSLENFAGDESNTNTTPSVPSQGSSLMNEMYEAKTVSSQESKSMLNAIEKSETNSKQESEFLLNKILKTESTSSQPIKLAMEKQIEIEPIKAEENTERIYINFKWKGKAIQHSVSSAEFKELGCSTHDSVSTLAFNIAAKHFPNDYQDVHLHVQVSDEIWNQISKTIANEIKSPEILPIKEDMNEINCKGEEEMSECANAATSEPQCVKVVTSSGQQGNLNLSKNGISYHHLQEWIYGEFKIPANKQKIKWGFPPKELNAPTDINKPNLPLKHGDRLLVENDNLNVSQQKNYLNTAPDNSRIDCQSFGDSNKPHELQWSVLKHEPDLFKKGGSLFEKAVNKLILCDKTHLTIPGLPTKRFCYNAATVSLELCVKLIGHFQISGDVDERVERAKRGENVPGVKKCPATTGPSKEAVVTRPYRKPISRSPEESRSNIQRKGPGVSFLSKPAEEMDVT